ncbi:MAG: RNA pyrophosphohydrolase [Alphaproteobacteria bacterium]|nr:MAG: RNA pyrophosphohydrolase [Alphaproteobacteria bacterium]
MSDIDVNALPYRPNVGIVLINKEGLIWAGQRVFGVPGAEEAWQMPQGGIDEGEDIEAAAFREMEEEIGTDKARVLRVTRDWIAYDLPPELIGKALKGKYRGQKQKWFAMEFLGQDSDINIATEEPEFHTWAWRTADDLLRDIVEFKRNIYAHVFEEFEDLLA